MCKASIVFFENKIFLMWNSDQDATSVSSNTSDICDKKVIKNQSIWKSNIGKLRVWSIILCNMTLKTESVWLT